MGSVYLRGQPISVVKRFFDVDPLTGVGTPEDPDVVTFSILDPDNRDTDYVFGIDAEVTNPAVGVYLLQVPPESPVGAYKWRCASSGSGLIDAEEGAFDVIESGVLPPDPPTVAVTGPCSSWIDGDDVAAFGPDLGVGSDTYLLDDAAYMASSLLYDLSGRQFPGVCQRTIRPCIQSCGCWGAQLIWPASPGALNWFWGGGGAWGGGVGPVWINDYGTTCGCGGTSEINMGGYPVREILEVKIDGVDLPEVDTDTGALNWQLNDRRTLQRMWAPGPVDGNDPTPQWWPSCQNLNLSDDRPGTYSVKYTYGADVPPLGRAAAAQLARELWLATNGKPCALPTKATKVVRQGITIERIVSFAQMFRQGSTGIQLVDAFIAQYNPIGMIRRPAVFSPDVEFYGRKVGQD